MFCISWGFSEICCNRLCIPGLLKIPLTPKRNKKKLFMDLLLAGESINTCRKEDCCLLPLPRLPALTPRGLDTLGLVPAGVLVLPVVLPPLSGGLDEFGGPHGLGSGSRFSVRDGWAPESEVPPRAENGLLPNYRNRCQTQLSKCGWSYSLKLGFFFFLQKTLSDTCSLAALNMGSWISVYILRKAL